MKTETHKHSIPNQIFQNFKFEHFYYTFYTKKSEQRQRQHVVGIEMHAISYT